MTMNDKAMEQADLYFKMLCNYTSSEKLIKNAYCAGYYDAAFEARADRRKEQEEGLLGVTVNGWVARNKKGNIYAYPCRPIRLSNCWIALMGGSLSLPTMPPFSSLTWESDPIEVSITIKPKVQ